MHSAALFLVMAPIRNKRAKSSSMRKLVNDVLLSHQEIKRGDTTGSTTWTTAGAIIPVTQLIVQGDTIASRSGDKIMPRKLEVNFSTVTALVPILGRLIIFQDMLSVGVYPTVTDLLDGGAYNSAYAPQRAQQRRFKILYDRTHASVTNATTITNSTKIVEKIVLRMKGKINYNGASSVEASNGPGAIYMLFISDAASGAGSNYSYYTALSYTDS